MGRIKQNEQPFFPLQGLGGVACCSWACKTATVFAIRFHRKGGQCVAGRAAVPLMHTARVQVLA